MQNSLIKAIIFDFGGVIGANSNQNIFKAINSEFGIEYEKIKKEYFKIVPLAQLNQIPKKIFWKKLAKKLDIQDSNFLKTKWLDFYRENVKINAVLIDYVKYLKFNGFKVAILSNLAQFKKRIFKPIRICVCTSKNIKIGNKKSYEVEKYIWDACDNNK